MIGKTKILPAFLFLFVLAAPGFCQEQIEVLIKGFDDGVKTSQRRDFREALMDAKLQAIERAGVEIQSITKVENFEVRFDMVESRAKALLMPGFQILDLGYRDQTYQVVLSGKAKALDLPKKPAPAVSSSKIKTNSLGMEFVYIPPGSFIMGSPENESDRKPDEKQHRVVLTRGFHIQTTEVTQGQWKEVMGANPSYFKKCGDDCPVETVSWQDAMAFIKKLNALEKTHLYALPTEAQWEYACRAGTLSPYSWGHAIDCSKANFGNGYMRTDCKGVNPGKTMPVKSFPPNAWGLYDMHGNVQEMCADSCSEIQDKWLVVTDTYVDGAKDPLCKKGDQRVRRGGRWNSRAVSIRSAARSSGAPDYAKNRMGFRVVRNTEGI